MAIIHNDPDITRIMHLLESAHFNQFERGIFDPILHSLTSPHDPWLTIADLRAFIDAQQQAALAYQDEERWTRMSRPHHARIQCGNLETQAAAGNAARLN